MSPVVEEAMQNVIEEIKSTDWKKESQLTILLDDSFSLEEERDIYDATLLALRMLHLTHVRVKMTRRATA